VTFWVVLGITRRNWTYSLECDLICIRIGSLFFEWLARNFCHCCCYPSNFLYEMARVEITNVWNLSILLWWAKACRFSFSSSLLPPTYLFQALQLHESRGLKAMKELGILSTLLRFIVQDRYSSYFNFKQCIHAICGSHLLRDLKNFIFAIIFSALSIWGGAFRE